ncbi:hypothetical protein BJ986_002125 [Phycicoccus badiiscoriae]|uniref:Glycosyltransferase n=1 Tax=Pedococcus badiiscoriae TaxID=642776 RepID=A0A852WF60_9MICO|nr:glycosyltransferase [Pedococcus badiiscoriae]NYG07638.1 hypothetical protein [Pedococcus badiiscoriae]
MSDVSRPTTWPRPGSRTTQLLVGPANFAGQGRGWAAAARRLPDVDALSFQVATSTTLAEPADFVLDRVAFDDPGLARARESWVTSFTHVLVEAGRPVTGTQHGLDAAGDLAFLEDARVRVGMVAHGTDVRRPDRHLDAEPDSPFARMADDTVRLRQRHADRMAGLMTRRDWSFVSTPDLLLDVPTARWLPVVVDPARWSPQPWEPAPAGRPPRVVHVPSHRQVKGTALIEPAVLELARRGLIDYTPLHDVAWAEMPAVIASADIVLDQFALGGYGVAAVEAMASGRAVVGHVRPDVRAHVQAVTGRVLPVVQSRAADVADVLMELVQDRDRWLAVARQGAEFASCVHDGRLSAEVLRTFLLSRSTESLPPAPRP